MEGGRPSQPRHLLVSLVNITFNYCVLIQLYEKGGENNEVPARGKLVEIVRKAQEVGFTTLVRALAKTGQIRLAKRLDETLAEKYGTKRPEAACMCSYDM